MGLFDQNEEIFRNYNFKLMIHGVTRGHFTQCSGIEIDVLAIPFREGGNTQLVRQLPGPVRYGAVTLSYGLTDSTDLWKWFQGAVKGEVKRKNVSIVLLDNRGSSEVTRWNLTNAWPSSWRGAPLDAMSTQAAIEKLTLVFESVERD